MGAGTTVIWDLTLEVRNWAQFQIQQGKVGLSSQGGVGVSGWKITRRKYQGYGEVLSTWTSQGLAESRQR